MTEDVALVFWAVVLARLILPMFIPRYPLPAIIGCLVLDGVDQSIFHLFGYDPPGYQGYDKAMDVYYLALAYIATQRNWTSLPAIRIARFLFFYRLVGVVLFELTGARWLLLVFANTFEYFFIGYSLVQTRWDPSRYPRSFWLWMAAGILVVLKLPQETWVHIAQLDLTDTIRDVAWFGPTLVGVLAVAGAGFWFAIRPRLDPPEHAFQLAAGPLPPEVDEAAERDAWYRKHERVWSLATLEKIVLVGLTSVAFGEILPGLRATDLQLFTGIAVFVVINAAWSLIVAHRFRTREAGWALAMGRMGFNLALVMALGMLLGNEGGFLPATNTLFFIFLLSLMTSLHDRYRPVAGARFGQQPQPPRTLDSTASASST